MKNIFLCLLLCLAVTSAQPEAGLARCRRPLCECVHGYRTDQNGCATEECQCLSNPCENLSCDEDEVCEKSSCAEHPCTELKARCVIQTPQSNGGMPCAMPMCANRCEYGYKKSAAGCDTCECVEAPANILDPAKPMPKLCHLERSFLESLKEEMAGKPSVSADLSERMQKHVDCYEDGTFKPRQCSQDGSSCWCVDDRGVERTGTRVNEIISQQSLPVCVPHITKKIVIKMVLIHDFVDVQPHLMGIKRTVGEHMSSWLEVQQKYVEVIKILPHEVEVNLVRVEVVIRHDGQSDLAYLAQRFQLNVAAERHMMQCHGGHLTVDPDSVQVQHSIEPLREEPTDVDEPGSYMPESNCHRMWREHKPLIIVAGCGATVFITVIIALLIVTCKKRKMASVQFKHNRMDRYAENLAYQNDVYGSASVMTEKEKLESLETVAEIKAEEIQYKCIESEKY